jgi:hypothetical protein
VSAARSRPTRALPNTDRPVAMHREAEALPAPALSLDPPQLSGGVLLRARKKPVENTSTCSLVRPDLSQGQNGRGLLSRTGKFPMVGGPETGAAVGPVPSQIQGSSKYGVLPAPRIAGVAAELVPPAQLDPTRNLTLTLRMKIALLIAAVVLIIVGLAGFLWFTHHAHAYAPPASTTVITTRVLQG